MFGWFKKKKREEEIIHSKFAVGQKVRYVGRDFISIPGVIYRVYKGPNGETLYDVQVGGECPYVKKGLKEDEIKG